MPGVDVYGWIGLNLFQVLVPGALGSLLCATAYMLVCWLLGYVLDRRNIVVSV
jgi:alpha-N-acetylglucosaminidase